MAASVSIRVHGLDELGDSFDAFLEQLLTELAPGFLPEAQYRGMAGEPFTLEKIDLVSVQVGLV